jgi:hypothetical protein
MQKHGNDTAVLKGLKALVTQAGDLATSPASAMTSQQLDTAVQLLKDAQLSVVKSSLDGKAAQEATKQVQLLAQLAAEVLTVPAGSSAVVSNGRLLVDHTPGRLACCGGVSPGFHLHVQRGTHKQDTAGADASMAASVLWLDVEAAMLCCV